MKKIDSVVLFPGLEWTPSGLKGGMCCLGLRPKTTRTARRVFGRVADIVIPAPIVTVSSGVF